MKNLIDPRRKQFEQRAGNGTVKQHGDGQRRVPAPPRNSPCPCGSGKKAKKCHPEGLRPVLRRTEEGTCEVCGKENVTVIPIKHEGVPDWKPVVCLECMRKPGTIKALFDKAGATAAVTAVEVEDAKEFAEEMRADSDRDLKAAEAHLHHEPEAIPDGLP